MDSLRTARRRVTRGRSTLNPTSSSFKYQEREISEVRLAEKEMAELGRKIQGKDAVDLGFQPPGDRY